MTVVGSLRRGGEGAGRRLRGAPGSGGRQGPGRTGNQGARRLAALLGALRGAARLLQRLRPPQRCASLLYAYLFGDCACLHACVYVGARACACTKLMRKSNALRLDKAMAVRVFAILLLCQIAIAYPCPCLPLRCKCCQVSVPRLTMNLSDGVLGWVANAYLGAGIGGTGEEGLRGGWLHLRVGEVRWC